MIPVRPLIILAAAVAALATATCALAISRGTLDGDAHPYVGLVRFDDALATTPTWRCSGALLSPTVLLTAGHCTDGAVTAKVWFDSTGATAGNPSFVEGTPHVHPAFDGFVTFPNTSDVGVVVLDESVVLDRYAELAPPGYLDDFAKVSKKKATIQFTAVGYGLQDSHPAVVAEPDRYQATTDLVSLVNANTDGWNLRTSNNAVTGGTCPGDSGGPFLLVDSPDTVVSVNSFSNSGHCSGADYSYRVDTDHAQDWLTEFLEP